MKPRSARFLRFDLSWIDLPLIDLLLVTALVGGIFTLSTPAGEQPAIPDFSTTPQHAQALEEMTTVRLGLLAWLVDQVGFQAKEKTMASPCGSFDVETLPIVTQSELETLLVPNYLTAVPEFDPWGAAYEYRMAGSLLDPDFASMRSAGADGLFEGTSYLGGYTSGPDDDMVWARFNWLRRQPLGGAIARQTEAISELQSVGTAMFSWVIDQSVLTELPTDPRVAGGTVDMTDYPPIDTATLSSMLTPQYIQCVPELDPWGEPYDYRLNSNLNAAHVMAIRTAGQDRLFAGDVYPIGQFPADEFEHDLVWADGLLAVSPDGVHEVLFADGFELGLWGTWQAPE
ncbi:MAG: hypothetical protein K8J08_22800 [Thermoanaerobaculia bacterium]|nr:hypothetical protein [Thermoanaerobaculia bacterium]